MKKIKSWLCLMLILPLCMNVLCFFAEEGDGRTESYKANEFISPDSSAYIPVVQNDKYRLLYCSDTGAIRIEGVSGENLWDSAVTSEVYDTSQLTDTFRAYTNSLIAVSYCKKDDLSCNYSKDYSSLYSNKATAYKLSDGIRMDYSFTLPKIELSLEIRLTDEGLKVRIPYESVKERGDYILYCAEVFPFFGAASEHDDGYLFYPDGSGAVTEFRNSRTKSRFTDELVLDVYSPHDDEEQLSDSVSQVMLPVYGVKRNDSAFIACVDKGDENVSIHVSPCLFMSTVPVNRAYFVFKYRTQYRMYVSNTVKGNQDKNTLQYKLKLNEELLDGDREMSILLLDTPDADYSGMANVYRNHLTENGLLGERLDESEPALALDMYMTVNNPDSLIGNKVTATTADGAIEISGDYLDSGMDKITLRLLGWSDDGGALPQSTKAASEAGGGKALKKLNAFAEKTENITMLLNADPILTSEVKNSAVMGNLIPISDENEETFLLSPGKTVRLFNKFVSCISKYPSLKLSVDSSAKFLYGDCRKGRKYTRKDTMEEESRMLADDSVYAAGGGNLYALNKVTRLYDIPISSSGYSVTDYSVPFYQMVVHGYVRYTSSLPANLSPDVQTEFLKWLEYGCDPYFLLTEKNSAVLSGTSADTLFSSCNSDWKDTVSEIFCRYKRDLSGLANKTVISHTRISPTASAVIYENGTTVIINYGDSAITYDGVEVQPHDYSVKGAKT